MTGAAPTPVDAAGGSFQSIISDIRAQLADISRRENQLAAAADEQLRRQQELDSAAAALVRREQAHHEAERRLAGREAQLHEREQRLAAQNAELDRREATVAERRAAVEKLYRQALDVNERTQAQQEQVVAVRQQLDQREAELRRQVLQLEIERGQLEADRGSFVAPPRESALSAVAEAVATPTPAAAQAPTAAAVPTAVVAVADAVVAADVPPPSTVPSTANEPPPPTARRRPPHRWLRTLALSAIAGTAAAGAWLRIEPRMMRASTTIRVENAPSPASAAAHAAALLNERDWLASLPDVETRRWTEAVADGRVVALAEPGGVGFAASYRTDDAAAADALLTQAVRAYVHQVNERTASAADAPGWKLWRKLRDDVEAEVGELRSELEAVEHSIAALGAPAAQDAAECGADELRSSYESATVDFETARDELARLQLQGAPHGTVSEEQAGATLDADASYQEDRRELLATVREYRTELAVAMVGVEEAARGLRASVQALVRTLTEQRDLQPPQAVLLVIEEALRASDEHDHALAEFLQQWSEGREFVERTATDAQAEELLKAQPDFARSVGEIVQGTQALAKTLDQSVAGLTQSGEAGTRGTVVASVLRGELGRVSSRVREAAEARKAVDTASNVRLDALDRQLRNLRTRLRDREETLLAQAQAQADRQARAAYEQRVLDAAQRVQAAQKEQQSRLNALLAHYAEAGARQPAPDPRAELDVRRALLRGRLQRAEQRLAEVQGQEPRVECERLAADDVSVETIAGLHRERNAGTAGAAGFVFTLLACRLMAAPARSPKA
ncbi:MAG: hypothetical protein HRF50_03550 [Phycisphaerae bacterium]